MLLDEKLGYSEPGGRVLPKVGSARIALYFSLHNHCLFKHSSDENKGNNHQGLDVLIFSHILLASSIKNVWRTVKGNYTNFHIRVKG